MADRTASCTWQGSLTAGTGQARLDSSGAAELAVSWPARTDDEPGGLTSPEELVAAAHASCYSMALSAGLGRQGYEPERVDTTATVTIEKGEGGFAVTRVALRVRASVPGADEATFAEAAEGAKDGCPISKLIGDDAEITLDAALEG